MALGIFGPGVGSSSQNYYLVIQKKCFHRECKETLIRNTISALLFIYLVSVINTMIKSNLQGEKKVLGAYGPRGRVHNDIGDKEAGSKLKIVLSAWQVWCV